QVLGKPDAHKITRQRTGQARLERLEHGVHRGLRLPDREAADREPGPGAEVEDASQACGAELDVRAALEDGPESLRLRRKDGRTERGWRARRRFPCIPLPPFPFRHSVALLQLILLSRARLQPS